MDVRFCETCDKKTPYKGNRCLACNTRAPGGYPLRRVFVLLGMAVVGAAVVIGPVAWQAASISADSRQQASALKEPLGATPGEGCLELARSSLLDPDSAYLVSERVADGRVLIDYRAKNAMGGFIPAMDSCPMSGDTITEMDRPAYELEAISRQISAEH